MEQYRVIKKPLFLKEGIVALTDDQAAPRKHLVKNVKKDIYEIEREACFKVGETIGIDERYAKPLLKIGRIEEKDKKEIKPQAGKGNDPKKLPDK